MAKIGTAFRAFFRILSDGALAQEVNDLLSGVEKIAEKAEPSQPAPVKRAETPSQPSRSDAITLLESMQRDARFIDFCMESLDEYADAQVGAAARDVQRGCRTVLDRMFQIEPLRKEAEGDSIEVPETFDSGQIRLIGKVAGSPPFQGSLAHHGWKANKSELPTWKGNVESSLVIAPAEVELK